MGRKKKILFFVINLPSHILKNVIKAPSLISEIIQNNLAIWEKNSNCYYSLLKRPQKACDAVYIEKETEFHKKTAIIIQGQIEPCFDFLTETISFYKKLYPGTTIIISTWDSENIDYIAKLMSCGAVVVLSKMPEKSGYCSLNYQVTNTLAGIKKAKELGKSYVFKTRTDYRFYGRNIINAMCCLMENYPIDKNVCYQKYRIVAGGEIADSMYRPYWIADQFMFGFVDDMLNFWNYKIRDVDCNAKTVREIITKEHLSWNERTERNLTAEPALVRDYLMRMTGKLPETNVKAYWELLKHQFIMVSRSDLGFYWEKYEYKYDESFSSGFYYDNNNANLCLNYNWTFSDWLALYNGILKYNVEYERFGEENHY